MQSGNAISATSVFRSNLLLPLSTTGIGDFGLLTNNLISFLSVFPLYSLVYFIILLYYITLTNLYNEIVLVLEVLQEALELLFNFRGYSFLKKNFSLELIMNFMALTQR